MVENVTKECYKDKILSFFEAKLSNLTNDFFTSSHSYFEFIVLWCYIQNEIFLFYGLMRFKIFLFLKVHMNFRFFSTWNFSNNEISSKMS